MININYADIFSTLPPELAVMLIAFIPIAELRASIPIALEIYKMSVPAAIFWSVLADIIISAVIIYSLDPVYRKLAGRLKIIDRFFIWLFKRTRRKFFHKYEVFGSIALILFVAIPLPITGAWTGSIASWLFDIPKGKSLFYVSLGVIISAGIVAAISLGIFKIF
jgi:uncharacterized membrane protein